MAIVNRVPVGFLPLLDAKSGGNTPAQISEFLQPTLDMAELYMTDIPFEVEIDSTTHQPAIGTINNPITIPAGQQWLVYFVNAQVIYQTASQSIRCAVSLDVSSDNSANVTIANDEPGGFTSVALQRQNAICQFERPVIFRSGTRFACQVVGGSWAATNGTTITTVLYRKLQL